MKPNDANGRKAPGDRPLRVLILAGSQRHYENCPAAYSKAKLLMQRMAERLPQHLEIDSEDLGNEKGKPRIQSCNACVSTSMALCVWPCNCYSKDSDKQPDLLWNLDLYARLDLADAWAIIGPVNWYAPSSNFKLLFDRLVCMSGGNPRADLINHKDAEIAKELEHKPVWRDLTLNHLEGRTAGFFSYGDEGADEIDDEGRPKILERKGYFDPQHEPFADARQAYAPLVWQCRYSGVEVPDTLWRHRDFGMRKKYSDNQQEDLATDAATLTVFDGWVDAFANFVQKKGAVTPGRYRAFGYQPPQRQQAKAS